MSNLQPIETKYNGYRFRSRLEARWAVAFDAMGIKYTYEPEGYDLGSGIKYLPDFYLSNVRTRAGIGLWAEVKGVLTEDDAQKIRLFSGEEVIINGTVYGRESAALEELLQNSTQQLPDGKQIIVIGQFPDHGFSFGDRDDEDYFWTFRFIDGDWYTGEFSKCDGEIWFCGADHDEYDGGRLMDIGIAAARQARFEHGE